MRLAELRPPGVSVCRLVTDPIRAVRQLSRAKDLSRTPAPDVRLLAWYTHKERCGRIETVGWRTHEERRGGPSPDATLVCYRGASRWDHQSSVRAAIRGLLEARLAVRRGLPAPRAVALAEPISPAPTSGRTSSRPEHVEGAVGGDRVEPRANRGSLLEAGEPTPGREQRLLERVLGVLDRAEDPIAVGMQARPVGPAR